MSSSIFQLPDELVFTALTQSFPCRDSQIRSLATLFYPAAAPCRNVVVYGTESTGKSVVTEAVLERMAEDAANMSYAVINSIECITGRHLLETTVSKVADALECDDVALRCENLSQLTVELGRMIGAGGGDCGAGVERAPGWRFVLVFDAIDRQRDAPPTLLPALARLSEILPNLTTVFILTAPLPGVLRAQGIPHVHFPNYTKSEFIQIISATPPPALSAATAAETSELWTRFIGPVHDSMAKAAARTLPSLRHACNALWPRFTAPILAGTHGPREFTKLLVTARVHLQDEGILDPGIIASSTTANGTSQGADGPATTGSTSGALVVPSAAATTQQQQRKTASSSAPSLSSLLPITARLVLVAAYLASHNATKHDLTLFSTHYHGRRRRRGGLTAGSRPRSRHRKIARKLLGAHAFVFERMLAIYVAVRSEWAAATAATANQCCDMDGDTAMAVATLSSLRLLMRVGGGGDPTEHGGKWRVNVGWEVIRALGRSMGVEVEEWLID